MKPTEDLHQLIKSLSKSEKRHFKIYASRHISGKENNYIKLFDIIEKQSKYDEAKILDIFKDKPVAANFRVAKKYLYDMVLESLTVYHKTSSVNREIKTLLIQVEILNEKGLYTQCKKLLEKAKELAYKRENYFIINDMLELEYNILVAKRFSEITPEELKEFFNYKIRSLDVAKNISEYEYLSAQMFSLYLQGGETRDEEYLKKLDKVKSSKLLESSSHSQSYFAEILRLNTNLIYYQKIANYNEAYLCAVKIIEMLESKPFFLSKRLNSYVSALNNLFVLQKSLKKFSECRDTISKMKSVVPSSHKVEINLFINSFQSELNLCNDTGEFEKGAAIIPEVESKLEEYGSSISKSDVMVFNFNMGHIYFGLADYDNALKYNNRIINNLNQGERFDILYYSRLINLIIHFELQNLDYLPYLIRDTYKFFLHNRNLYRLEEIILKFIKKIARIDRKELLVEFKILKAELNKLKVNTSESLMFEAFDLISWLDSKIKGITYQEAVKLNLK